MCDTVARTVETLSLPITTARLTLRAHVSQDVAALHSIYSRPDVAQFLLDEPWTLDLATKKVHERIPRTGLLGKERALNLAIILDETVIGSVALWLTSEPTLSEEPTDLSRATAELGWVLDPDFSGKGYAAESVSALLRIAFTHYRVHRVVAQMDARNHASAKLAERVGMSQEAHFRQDWWSKGEWTDTLVFAILCEHFSASDDG